MWPDKDRVRLTHMLTEARKAVEFCGGSTAGALRDDELRAYAIVRALEIIGEAAAKVTAETRAAIPNLPWADVVGMRNRLIHAYHDVNLEVVLQTVNGDLPALIEELERALD